ncbi:MAG TPA: hypothetical protein IAC12_00370 [Candidatus Aphodovivens avistercoris]|nr:hypothetical protein [Candidatus Aphodovivens avistercoris]
MFERDYLMRLILGFFQTVCIVVRRAEKEKDPEGAADLLERAIGDATELDGDVLLSLSPDSIASILQVSGTDPKVVGFVAHALLLESHYLMMACDFARAELREQQARALAEAYGVDLPDDPAEAEGLLLDAAEQGLAADGAAEDGSDAVGGAAAGEGALLDAVGQAHATAYYDEEDVSARFDPDAPLMPNALREEGRFGWDGGK